MVSLMIFAALVTTVSTSQEQYYPPVKPRWTGVHMYMPWDRRFLPNWFLIDAGRFFDTARFTGYINAIWCDVPGGSMGGRWYHPNGTVMPNYEGLFGGRDAPSPLYAKAVPGRVALARKGGVRDHQGIYKCVIYDDQNRITQYQYLGVMALSTYQVHAGPTVDKTMNFTLVSLRTDHGFVYSMTFFVYYGPPTYLNCFYVSSNRDVKIDLNNNTTRSIADGPNFITLVTIRLTKRLNGQYTCHVGNNRIEQNNLYRRAYNKSIEDYTKTIGAPTGLAVTRLQAEVKLTWSPVENADGYEVVYQLTGTAVTNGTGNIEGTSIVLGASHLQLEKSYDFFVLAYKNERHCIPSALSNSVTIIPWPKTTFIGGGGGFIVQPPAPQPTTSSSSTTSKVSNQPSIIPSSHSSSSSIGRISRTPQPTLEPMNTVDIILFISIPLVWAVVFITVIVFVSCIIQNSRMKIQK